MADPERATGLQAVEILHIDTQGSQKFFAEVSPSEKCDCQQLLFDLFTECCQQADGWVAANWQGDGGHAFFPVKNQSGNSVRAARVFLSKLPVLAEQTATTLGRRLSVNAAHRSFRVKAHFGNVFLGQDARTDAGSPKDFDAFLKYEKALAPLPNEVFITDQLRQNLGGPERQQFEKHKDAADYGGLHTALYRAKARPVDKARNLLNF